jgi:hypothetical protein
MKYPNTPGVVAALGIIAILSFWVMTWDARYLKTIRERKATMAELNITPVPREVIEDQLLVALDDKSKVALVASEADLNLLIFALECSKIDREDAVTMRQDLIKLRTSAFGK